MNTFLLYIKNKILKNQEHLELVIKNNHTVKILIIILLKKYGEIFIILLKDIFQNHLIEKFYRK